MMEHPSARLSPSDMPLLDEAARYAKHALAIYTWVLYLYEHPMTGPIRLAVHGKCCCGGDSPTRDRDYSELSSPRRFRGSFVTGLNGPRLDGDNAFQTNKKAILSTAGITEDDLVYVQLQSSFNDNPYCIMLDHGWKTVVVSVRGTFSLEDCVTDTLISPVLLEQLGQECGFDATDQYCHSGVAVCARNVYRDLNQHRILDQLLLGANALYPDYTLRLVGHSLVRVNPHLFLRYGAMITSHIGNSIPGSVIQCTAIVHAPFQVSNTALHSI
jgi:sn1-specific diacylglycerol lipase